jgi:WD40 repeat protein
MQNAPVAVISESIGDDVTQLQFHPLYPSILCSGSTDGLLCAFDVHQLRAAEQAEDAEDDALLCVFNSESSVSKFGYFGPHHEFMYLQTHIETLSLWSLETGNKVVDFGDVRQSDPPMAYLIDHVYDPKSQMLCAYGGTHDGDVMVYNVSMDGLAYLKTLPKLHSATLRCLAAMPDGKVFLAGEDGRISVFTQ